MQKRLHLISLTLAWAALVFMVALFAELSLPDAPNSSYTLAGTFEGAGKLAAPLARYDSAHYFALAQHGYSNAHPHLFAFFPLYPLLLKVLSFPLSLVFSTHLALPIAAVLISLGCIIAAVVVARKLFELDTDKQTASLAAMLMLVSPFAFFYLAAYTEALFLLLIVSAFLAARKKMWWLAGLIALLAGATRLPGLLLGPALALEYLHQSNWRWRNVKLHSLWLLLCPLGALGYLAYLHVAFGSYELYFSAYHLGWPERVFNPNILVPLTEPLLGLIRDGGISMNAILSLAAVGVAAGLLIYGFKRIRPSYVLFAVISMILPLISTTLDSTGRYYMLIFPLYLVAALLLRERPTLQVIAIMTGSLLTALLTTMFTNGYFVG